LNEEGRRKKEEEGRRRKKEGRENFLFEVTNKENS
jgi:hypothetical protein